MKKLFSLFFILFLGMLAHGQAYNEGYPTVTGIDETTATVVTNITLTGYYTNFIILEATEPTPTIQEVIDWAYNGKGGTLTEGTYGEIAVSGRGSANADKISEVTNLVGNTNYTLYCVTTDGSYTAGSGIEDTSPTEYDFSTISAAPQWTTVAYNNGLNKTDLTVSGTVDKSGTFYAVVTSSPTVPSEAQIVAGTDETDTTVPYISGATDADVLFSGTLDISSLSSETLYYVHTVANDGSSYSSIESFSFTTLDTEAPSYIVSYPSVQILDEASIFLNIQTSEEGQFYYVILPSGEATPSTNQVISGTDASDVFVTLSGNGPLFDDIVSSYPVSGLSENTDYVVYIVSQDANSNPIETSTPTAIAFTTPYAAPEVTAYLPTQNSTNVAINQSLQITFNQNIQFISGSSARVYILRASDDSEFISYGISSGQVSISNATLTISHLTDFEENTSYYVTIDDGFLESASTEADFYGFEDPTDWAFTTETRGAQWNSGFPSIDSPSRENVVFNGQVDRSGTYYYIVTQSNTAPSAAQLKLGNDENDALALLSGTAAINTDETFSPSIDISALATETQYWIYVVVETNTDLFSTVESMTFTTLQTAWSETYPNIQNQTKTDMDIYGQADGSGSYYLVVTASSTVPTEAQIKSGLDELGDAALITANAAISSDTEFVANLDISTLTSETDYWVYIVVEDTFGHYSAISQLAFTQLDTTAPFYTASTPQITNITGITATLEVQTNEDGRTYWVILPEGATAPSIAQVLSGSDADDAPVSSSGNRGLTANDLEQVVTNSYTSETSYIAYIVSCDNNSNYIETTSPTAILFSTADVTPPSAIFDPVDASVDIALDKTITITFTEAIYNTTDELITNSNISSIISFTESNSGGTPVAATISYDEINYVITIDPTDNLKELQLYNIELSDLQDADGNLRSTSNTTFTTEDTTPPTTTFVDPQNDDTNVSIGAPLEISFNESVRKLDNTPISNTDLESIITFSPAATFTATINASNDGILIYPYPYLSSETEYTITIDPVEDYSGNEQIASSSITFTTAKFNIWNGNAGDNDFSNSANYEIGYTYGAGVLVAANEPLMIISDDANIPHLIIEPLAKVTIASGTTVTLSDELTIISDASGSGSLIIDGTLSVSSSKINIQQNITDASQYEFVSPPVQGATHASIGADGAIYSWNNQTGNWDSQTTDASLNPMSGYILKSSNDLLYNGALNRGSFSIDAKGTPKNSGFTLAGNPYTAAIDWDLIAANDKFNIKDKFWIYKNGIYANHDATTGIDTDLEGDASLIPSGHAFWIQANWSEGETVTGTLTVNESYLAHNETSYLKSGSSSKDAIPHIKLAGIHNGIQCEKAIGFTPNASEFYDQYDTPRFFGFSSDAIELYSIVEDKKLAINSYPELTNNMVIPLGYKTQSSGNFTIQLNNIIDLSSSLQVLLTDHVENVVLDLNAQGPYQFYSEAVTSNDRFSIQLVGDVSTAVETPVTAESINIYSIESTLYIKVDNIKNPQYTLYNIDGKLIDMGRLNPQSLNHIEMNGQKGIFIVKVIGDGFVTSKKVIIN